MGDWVRNKRRAHGSKPCSEVLDFKIPLPTIQWARVSLLPTTTRIYCQYGNRPAALGQLTSGVCGRCVCGRGGAQAEGSEAADDYNIAPDVVILIQQMVPIEGYPCKVSDDSPWRDYYPELMPVGPAHQFFIFRGWHEQVLRNTRRQHPDMYPQQYTQRHTHRSCAPPLPPRH